MGLTAWQAGAPPCDPAQRDRRMNGPPRRVIHEQRPYRQILDVREWFGLRGDGCGHYNRGLRVV